MSGSIKTVSSDSQWLLQNVLIALMNSIVNKVL